MTDAEYLACWEQVLLPVAREFDPDLVLVSAGFDAAMRDPLGGCLVSPEGYAHLLHRLLALAGGRVVVALEGGYHLAAIAESMAACGAVLAGAPPPPLDPPAKIRPSVADSLAATVAAHRPYWRCFQPAAAEPVAGAAGSAEPTASAEPAAADSLAAAVASLTL